MNVHRVLWARLHISPTEAKARWQNIFAIFAIKLSSCQPWMLFNTLVLHIILDVTSEFNVTSRRKKQEKQWWNCRYAICEALEAVYMRQCRMKGKSKNEILERNWNFGRWHFILIYETKIHMTETSLIEVKLYSIVIFKCSFTFFEF